MKSNIIVLILVAIMSVPLVALGAAWSPGQPLVVACSGGAGNCTWDDLIALVNRLIFFMLYLATILAVIAFIYAGFLLITAGGNEGKATEAKEIFTKVVIGMIFAYGAWILVYFIVQALNVKSGYYLI